jgi:hypothetical protein
MWQLFWPNRFFKFLLIPILAMGPSKLLSVENIPGLLGSLLELQRSHNGQFDKYVSVLEKNDLKSEFFRAKEIRIDPFFMRSLIFYSDEMYFPILTEDQCSLYALIENNLLKTREGNIRNVGVVFKTKEGRQISALIEKKVFLNYVYENECQNQKDLSVLFSPKNFPKTFKTFTLSRPKTYSACLEQLDKVKKSLNTPYLCKIPKVIKEGKIADRILSSIGNNEEKKMLALSKISREKNYYLKNTSLFDQNYLNHLCENLDNPKNFCTFFRADDAWSKVIFGDLPTYKLDFKCMEYLKLIKLPSKDQLNLCANKFKENPQVCEPLNGGNTLYPSYPCDKLSTILKVSHLKTNFRDCPSKIDNDSVTNIYRIFQHFYEKKEVTTDVSACINNSYREALNVLARSDGDYSNWPLHMCFTDPKKSKEECLPYVPGSDMESPVSETRVLNQILQSTKGASRKEICTLVGTKEYNPVKLEYRNGCFIVFDTSACSSYYCPRKIIYRNEELKNIRYQGQGTINYFPNIPGKAFDSAVGALKRKLSVRFEELRSLSEIVRFFNKYKKGIAHGIGCLEDFYPYLFKKNALNACRPIPFIIDGIVKDANQKTWMSFRSTIDDVHGPHLIHWNNLFTSLKNYEEIHPLKTWTLYGIEK